MTRYVKATFSDGTVKKRSSLGRHYTHAWRVGREVGFSSSEELAHKAVGAWGEKALIREVVAVEEITAKEYREKGGAA